MKDKPENVDNLNNLKI